MLYHYISLHDDILSQLPPPISSMEVEKQEGPMQIAYHFLEIHIERLLKALRHGLVHLPRDNQGFYKKEKRQRFQHTKITSLLVTNLKVLKLTNKL
jgi:hypothetical protein